MPIPVPVPGSPIAITDGENASIEAILGMFVQIAKNGTSGATNNTPATLAPDPSDPSTLIPLDISSAAQQLFLRQVAVVLLKSISTYTPAPEAPTGGGILALSTLQSWSSPTPGVLSGVDVSSLGISAGKLTVTGYVDSGSMSVSLFNLTSSTVLSTLTFTETEATSKQSVELLFTAGHIYELRVSMSGEGMSGMIYWAGVV